MSEFPAEAITDIDQYIASLPEMIKGPLQNVAREIGAADGDNTIAYLRIAQDIVSRLEHGDTNFRVTIGMSYVGMLFLLHRKGNL